MQNNEDNDEDIAVLQEELIEEVGKTYKKMRVAQYLSMGIIPILFFAQHHDFISICSIVSATLMALTVGKIMEIIINIVRQKHASIKCNKD